jgi:hypothetical protein
MDTSGYLYDPGEGPKHKDNRAEEPCFVQEGSALVAKCPKDMARQTVLALLNDGIPFPEEWDEAEGPPKRIYNVHEGVPYVAQRNGPGSRHYHGYPLGNRNLPRAIRRKLEERAEAQGCGKEFERWCKEHRVH